jgi:hypothetical protein
MRSIAIIAALLTLAAPVTGNQIFSYFSRTSRIEIDGELPGAPPPQDHYHGVRSTSNFGTFDQAITDEIIWGGMSASSDASQTSILAPTTLSAAGATYMEVLSDDGTGVGSAWARSTFEVVFDLAQAAPIELTGWVHTPPGSGPPSGLACEVRLQRQVGASWAELYAALFEEPVDYAATLTTGRYRLKAEAYIAGDTDYAQYFPIMGGTFFDITMQIVPEPASVALLVLLVIGSRRRSVLRRGGREDR